MSNKTNIEEDKKILERIRNIFEHLKHYGWIEDIRREIDPDKAVEAIENILADRERLEKENKEYRKELNLDDLEEYIKELDVDILISDTRAIIDKAKKYDNLVEKIKSKIEYIKEEGYWEFTTDRDSDKCESILQELLDTEQEKN